MPHIISVKRVAKLAGVSFIAMGLVACAQTPKHTNTLMFATNTNWGVKVGTDEKEIPMVHVGYSRQEGAFVPVFANTAVDEEGGMIPCPSATIDKDGTATKIEIENLEDCKFIGTHDGTNEDSYSTLASFGGETGVDVGSGTGTKAKVRIAQYFATGIAAQYLAVTGGANIVSAGGDSAAKAVAAADAAVAIADKEKAAAIAQYTSGRQVALVMLGNDETDTLDTSLTDYITLEGKMGGGCDAAALDRVFTRKGVTTIAAGTLTVGQYLDQVLNHRPYCFDPLIPQSS